MKQPLTIEFGRQLLTHVGEGVVVPVGVGDGQEVEVDLVGVAVRRVVLHQFADDVRAHRRRDPFSGVDP